MMSFWDVIDVRRRLDSNILVSSAKRTTARKCFLGEAAFEHRDKNRMHHHSRASMASLTTSNSV
jgi:hypothetical protein